MDSIDLLEKRIAALELQVLGKDKNVTVDKSQTITDLLLQTQTMISSALCCREAITSILQHMTTINEYLNPSYEANEWDIEAKRRYLLELYPELKETMKLVATFQNLSLFADAGNISKVTELSEQLSHLASFNLTVYDESQEVTNNVFGALQQYSDIITSIKVLFAQLDRILTELEIAAQPKILPDE